MNQTFNHPVYRAIDTICALKGKATYGEVATVAGIKKQKALDYILRNKAILKLDKKGNVLGFITHEANVQRNVAAMFTQGKVFQTAGVNYGADKEIVVHEFYVEKVKHLLKPYCVGGLGDNYWTNYIIVTEENVKAMNDLGFREWDEVVKEKIAKGADQVWRDWCEV